MIFTFISVRAPGKKIIIDSIAKDKGTFQPGSYVPTNEQELLSVLEEAYEIQEDLIWQMEHRPMWARANGYDIIYGNGEDP